MNVSDKNEYRKVILENIVFLQGDDFVQFIDDINLDLCPSIDTDEIVQALLHWWYPGEHETGEYYARDINTPFLGELIKVDGIKGYFLYSVNSKIGYVGLSRIVEFSRG